MLTNVGLEHTRWLGPTSADIAEREGSTSCGRAGRSSSAPTCARGARGRRARLRRARRADRRPRRAVAGVAIAAEGALPAPQLRAAPARRRRRSSARSTRTPWPTRPRRRRPGRFEIVAKRPVTVFDGAHNPAGVRGAGRRAARLPGRAAARRCDRGPRRQGRRRDAARAAAAVRRGRLHRRREPARAAPATLRSLCRQLGGPPARVGAGPHARWPPRASWPGRTASCSPPARSICSPICCARRRRRGGRPCERAMARRCWR